MRRASERPASSRSHEERPQQGLGNEFIAPHTTKIGAGPMKCRERLDGLHKFYHREAA
jgi:hypothetical protein